MPNEARPKRLLRAVRLSPEAAFLILGSAFGLVFMFVTPPIQVPDENTHLRRAFQISEGTFVSVKAGGQTGGELPAALVHFSDDFTGMARRAESKLVRPLANLARVNAMYRLDPADRIFSNFPNTASYPPVPYLPQAAGIAAIRPFTSSILSYLYAARAVNLLVALALFWLAIRATPILKWAFVLLALTPMSLFVTASASSDAYTHGVCFLFVGMVFRCAFGPDDRLSSRQLAALIVLGAAVAMAKQGYAQLVLLYLLVPARKLGGARRYWLTFGLLAGTTALLLGAWGGLMRSIYSPLFDYVDPEAQMRYLTDHPGAFPMVLLRSSVRPSFALRLVWGYVGFLGWLDAPLPPFLVYLHVTFLTLVAALDFTPGGPRVRAGQKLVAAGVSVLTVALIVLASYLTFERVGARGSMIQGRYLIPLGPLLALCLYHSLFRFPSVFVGLAAGLTWLELAVPRPFAFQTAHFVPVGLFFGLPLYFAFRKLRWLAESVRDRLPVLVPLYATAALLWTLVTLIERYYSLG